MRPAKFEDDAKFVIGSHPFVQKILPLLLSSRARGMMALRSLFSRRLSTGPGTISVIVPFHNTEEYLGAALESIRLQRYWDLEVLLVDDGSTDRSSQIARDYAERDSRFHILTTPHVGPGAARNSALRVSTGEFIAFVDGDDILPIGALKRLAKTLAESGSDFATGAFEHLEENNRWRGEWVTREHMKSRVAVTLADVPGITRNVFPWNKLFRADFFNSEVVEFPEGVLYEDQVPTAVAYVKARAFDVLDATVYHWRRRVSGASITQNRSSDDHLADRFAAFEQVNAIYALNAPQLAYREWLLKSLLEDMMPFVEAAHHGSPAYRASLSERSREFWQLLTEDERIRAQEHPNYAVVALVIDGNFDAVYELLKGNG